jgi:hypothetical protein
MSHSLRVGAAGVVAIAYAWFATGVRPFSAGAYLYVAVPSFAAIALFVAAESRRRAERAATPRTIAALARPSTTPWWVIFTAAIALEIVGLALGGRSKTVPTLSTTVDHLLVTHAARWLLFAAWLAAAAWGLLQQTSRRA